MRELLISLALVFLALALRSSRMLVLRKIGALLLIAATCLILYFCCWRSLAAAGLGVLLWFMLPLFHLITRGRKMIMRREFKLQSVKPPQDSFFPNAAEAIHSIEEHGFEHVTDSSCEWAGMDQVYRIFWHPEEFCVAKVCLCQQENIAFAFVTISSKDKSGKTWKTTNYPFSSPLHVPPHIRWKLIPCEQKDFSKILEHHHRFLVDNQVAQNELLMPDPDRIHVDLETEMRQQLEHNITKGYVSCKACGSCSFSTRGLMFQWAQTLKDMIRLC